MYAGDISTPKAFLNIHLHASFKCNDKPDSTSVRLIDRIINHSQDNACPYVRYHEGLKQLRVDVCKSIFLYDLYVDSSCPQSLTALQLFDKLSFEH